MVDLDRRIVGDQRPELPVQLGFLALLTIAARAVTAKQGVQKSCRSVGSAATSLPVPAK